ncbi:MAG: response regulator [Planctomycetes bacterium]|nr:response regulator [Planctomycetota bacterium]
MIKTSLKALVVEDDANVVEFIRRTMVVLGHDYVCATNLQDARAALRKGDLHYVLLDLKIPALPDGMFPSIDSGMTFLSEIGTVRGKGRTAVFVMTSHTDQGFDMAAKLIEMGTTKCIPKPLENKPLSQIIQEVLAGHGKKYPLDGKAGQPVTEESKPFEGGVMAFFNDRIELLGQIIVENNGTGHAWGILQALRKKNASSGKSVNYSAAKLAKELGISGTANPHVKTAEDRSGENAIAQCVSELRNKIGEIMLESMNIGCQRDDVIDNRGKGYHLRNWITVDDHDRPIDTGTSVDVPASNVPANVPAPKADVPACPRNVPLNERQHWAIEQLQKDEKLGRTAIEKQFKIGEKTAKRDLGDLVKRGLIEFVRNPKPGHYRLTRRN